MSRFYQIFLTTFLSLSMISFGDDEQVITPSPLTQKKAIGDSFSIDVLYSTNPMQLASSGLSLNLHFDESTLRFDGLTEVHAQGLVSASSPTPVDESDMADDNDPLTDKMITMLWLDFSASPQWPSGNGSQPESLRLFSASFTVLPGFSGVTSINFTGDSPTGFDFTAQSSEVEEAPILTQSISLVIGWNHFSLNVRPANRAPSSVFGAIINKVEQVKRGDFTYTPDDPSSDSMPLNLLEDGNGYWVKMKAAATLGVVGPAVDPLSTPIPVSEGWNNIGFLPQEVVDIEVALDDLLPEAIEEVQQGSAIYRPNLPSQFNSLTVLSPGSGFWLKIKQGSGVTSFTYNTP